MPLHFCPECDKHLSSAQSLQRHVKNMHSNEADEEDENVDQGKHFYPKSSWEFRLPYFLDDEETDEEMADADEEVITIGAFIDDAIHDMEEISSVGDILENYQEVSKAFEAKVPATKPLTLSLWFWINGCPIIIQVRAVDRRMHQLNRTQFFNDIKDTIGKRQETISDINEAEDVAWDERRFALKYFLEENRDELDEYLFNEDSGDENETVNTMY